MNGDDIPDENLDRGAELVRLAWLICQGPAVRREVLKHPKGSATMLALFQVSLGLGELVMEIGGELAARELERRKAEGTDQ